MENTKVCEGCGGRFERPSRQKPGVWARRRFCSRGCAVRNVQPTPEQRRGPGRGADHPSWKGGRIVDESGYVRVLAPPDRPGQRYPFEHRLVMEEKLGRRLLPGETVHHVNGDRADNRVENLELWSSRHPRGQRVEDLVEFAREVLALYG